MGRAGEAGQPPQGTPPPHTLSKSGGLRRHLIPAADRADEPSRTSPLSPLLGVLSAGPLVGCCTMK